MHLPTLPNQGFGELDADLSRLLATETGDTTPFAVHSDSAPTYYVTGNPAQMAEVTRKLEHHVAALTAFDPIIGTDIPVTARLADQQEQSFLHMVTADPNRTPTFILFGDPDFFLFSSGTTTAARRCRHARPKPTASPGTMATFSRRSPTLGSVSSAPASTIRASPAKSSPITPTSGQR